MNNANVGDRMTSSNRTIRQRCELKYSKHRAWNWEKWIEYTCIFSSFVDAHQVQRYQLELHDSSNVNEPNGRVIDLRELRSLTYLHGKLDKHEPRDIIILDIGGRRHRLGFDVTDNYNQWKRLLDDVYKSSATKIEQSELTNHPTTNLLYESSDAVRYHVRFADQETRDLLKLPDDDCDLVFDNDKMIIEQNQDKQYTFVRTAVRHIIFNRPNQLQFITGSRAPVKGSMKFNFDTQSDCVSCYRQWYDQLAIMEAPRPPPRQTMKKMTKNEEYVDAHCNDNEEKKVPPRVPRNSQRASTFPGLIPPPRKINDNNPYYNGTLPASSESSETVNDDYASFDGLSAQKTTL